MMAKQNNYYVIGGQYQHYCYGGAPTLIGAKRMARRHMEYWDNWQVWHAPSIYRAEDVVVVDTPRGEIRIPADGSTPVATATVVGDNICWEAE